MFTCAWHGLFPEDGNLACLVCRLISGSRDNKHVTAPRQLVAQEGLLHVRQKGGIIKEGK